MFFSFFFFFYLHVDSLYLDFTLSEIEDFYQWNGTRKEFYFHIVHAEIHWSLFLLG